MITSDANRWREITEELSSMTDWKKPCQGRRLKEPSRQEEGLPRSLLLENLAMQKRSLRVVKWIGTIPAIGVCTQRATRRLVTQRISPRPDAYTCAGQILAEYQFLPAPHGGEGTPEPEIACCKPRRFLRAGYRPWA